MLASQSYFAYSKGGRPHPMNVERGIEITVMADTTTGASPLPLFKAECLIEMATSRASFRRWIKAINQVEGYTLLAGDVLKDIQKGAECQVADLAAPKRLHAFEIQVFQENRIVLVGQCVGKLEKEIMAQIVNPLKHTV